MYYKKVEDTYFSIIDYKTGTIDTHIEPMKYGLHMQLPVYLYLIHYSKIFTNPIFTGIYYQNILFNYPTWSPKLEKEVKDRYLLQGYSTDDTSILERFDSTFEESEYIKSMKYNAEKGFGHYSKVMDNDTLYELIKYTKKHIEDKTDEILSSDFKIDPKVYAGENISCKFCTYNDLCFMKEKDLVYLDKQEDLSFLGGEE
jgi:ATP-dependent helicase/DNAse subunit B